jgi:hypothetical protein
MGRTRVCERSTDADGGDIFNSRLKRSTIQRTYYAKGMRMTVQTLKMGGKKFVVIPEREFRRLQKKAEELSTQEKGDIEEAKRREHEPSVPIESILISHSGRKKP